jgi:EmrB/QacA subfamily drug resistance transporter
MVKETKQDEMVQVKSPYLQLFIVLLGAFMAVLDSSVVNVAIPKMETELNANTTQIQWVFTGYMLTTGILIPISGWLMDRFGTRRLFIFSLVMFTIGSAFCGLAWNLTSEILFRIVQAMGGAFSVPVAMAIIYRIFPVERRGVAMGLFGIVVMAAPAFGPVLSGYFVEFGTWRLIFYINVPIGIAASILAVLQLVEFPHKSTGKLDVWGFIFSTLGFFLLLFGFNKVSSDGWASFIVVACLSIGTLCIFILVIIELTVKKPMIELKLFKIYMFLTSTLLMGLLSIALFVSVFLIPVYLQNILGYSALRTGLFMTPAAIGSAIMMLVGGKLFNKVGARTLGLTGILIMGIGIYGFSQVGLNSNSTTIQTLYIIQNIGMGLGMMPIMTAGMNDVPLKFVSQGTALSNTVKQISASLGTAVLTNYMATQSTKHISTMSNALTPFSPSGIQVSILQNKLQAARITPGNAHLEALKIIQGWISKMGFVSGMDDTFFVSTILVLLAFVMTFFFKRKGDIQNHDESCVPIES